MPAKRQTNDVYAWTGYGMYSRLYFVLSSSGKLCKRQKDQRVRTGRLGRKKPIQKPLKESRIAPRIPVFLLLILVQYLYTSL
jgi:hypothetical protein